MSGIKLSNFVTYLTLVLGWSGFFILYYLPPATIQISESLNSEHFTATMSTIIDFSSHNNIIDTGHIIPKVSDLCIVTLIMFISKIVTCMHVKEPKQCFPRIATH